MPKYYTVLLLPALWMLLLSGCRHDLNLAREESPPPRPLSVAVVGVQPQEELTLAEIMPLLAQKRVVYVGEAHTRYGHHLLQLEIIKGLHAQGWDFAIGMEFFQQPYQWVLDAFVRGELSENEMLRQSQWYQRWQYDYRLYRPILQFARQHRIPVIALNVPKELTGKISEKGYAGLSAEERARLPREIDTSDEAYHRRLHAVFKQHSGRDEKDFERFKEVQLTWDEGMAQTVADYLQQHPDKKMVVLAGAGHLRYGSGIPNRVNRRIPVDYAIVLPSDKLETAPGLADYVVAPVDEKLPAKGLMGILIGAHEKDGVAVSGVTEGSAAEKAGIRKGDVILRIDERQVADLSDVRINMLDKRPGDPLRLQIQRGQERLEMNLVLEGE
ncbi:ChaN family lipoprotein [Thiolapillus sp.]